MKQEFPGGVWPVMLTPFTKENKVDEQGLKALTEWYIEHGVQGLFAVCQSSEMFFLSLEERIKAASIVKETSAGRVPVIASGHISDGFDDQVKELKAIAATGVDAVILITNRLAKEEESDEVWIDNLKLLLKELPEDLKLGFYECPYPYKRVMSKKMTEFCVNTGRFYFIKDTSCDIDNILAKLEATKGTQLKLYNANSATLLESLQAGAAGYSGVMANFHPDLYVKLCRDYAKEDLTELSDELTIMALIERQYYPINAKYHLQRAGLPLELCSRTKDAAGLSVTFQKEVQMLERMTKRLEDRFPLS